MVAERFPLRHVPNYAGAISLVLLITALAVAQSSVQSPAIVADKPAAAPAQLQEPSSTERILDRGTESENQQGTVCARDSATSPM